MVVESRRILPQLQVALAEGCSVQVLSSSADGLSSGFLGLPNVIRTSAWLEAWTGTKVGCCCSGACRDCVNANNNKLRGS